MFITVLLLRRVGLLDKDVCVKCLERNECLVQWQLGGDAF